MLFKKLKKNYILQFEIMSNLPYNLVILSITREKILSEKKRSTLF